MGLHRCFLLALHSVFCAAWLSFLSAGLTTARAGVLVGVSALQAGLQNLGAWTRAVQARG